MRGAEGWPRGRAALLFFFFYILSGRITSSLLIKALNAFAIPLTNTILLLTSGSFITYAHHGLLKGDRKVSINGTLITIILAIIFTGLQGYEYFQAPFTIADSVFGSAFFASTGLHGFRLVPTNF